MFDYTLAHWLTLLATAVLLNLDRCFSACDDGRSRTIGHTRYFGAGLYYCETGWCCIPAEDRIAGFILKKQFTLT